MFLFSAMIATARKLPVEVETARKILISVLSLGYKLMRLLLKCLHLQQLNKCAYVIYWKRNTSYNPLVVFVLYVSHFEACLSYNCIAFYVFVRESDQI